MPAFKFLTIAVCLISITACSAKQVYQGFYEGARVRGQLQTPPPERPGGLEAPTYQQYEILRTERIKPPETEPDYQ